MHLNSTVAFAECFRGGVQVTMEYEYEEVEIPESPSGMGEYGYEEVVISEHDPDYQYASQVADYGYASDNTPPQEPNLDYGYGDSQHQYQEQYQYEQQQEQYPQYHHYADYNMDYAPAPSQYRTESAANKGPPNRTKKKNRTISGNLGQFVQDSRALEEEAAGENMSPKQKKKQRGRRLSMFAFAGQDDDVDRLNNNTPSNSNHQSPSHQKQPPPANSSHASNKSSSQASIPKSTLHSASSDDDMLASFLKGGGMPGGGVQGSGGRGKASKSGRRLSMMAFTGGDNEEAHLDQQKTNASPTKSKTAALTSSASNKSASNTSNNNNSNILRPTNLVRRGTRAEGSTRLVPQRQLKRSNSGSDIGKVRAVAAASSNFLTSGGGKGTTEQQRNSLSQTQHTTTVPVTSAQPADTARLASPRRTKRRASIGAANPSAGVEHQYMGTPSATPVPRQSTVGRKPASLQKSSKPQSQSIPSQSMRGTGKAKSQAQQLADQKLRQKTNQQLSQTVHVDASGRTMGRNTATSISKGQSATRISSDASGQAPSRNSGASATSAKSSQTQPQSRASAAAATKAADNRMLSQSAHVTSSTSGHSRKMGPASPNGKKGSQSLSKSTHGTGGTRSTASSSQGNSSQLPQTSAPPRNLARSAQSTSQIPQATALSPVKKKSGSSVGALQRMEQMQSMPALILEEEDGAEETNEAGQSETPEDEGSGKQGTALSSAEQSIGSGSAASAPSPQPMVPSTNNMSLLYFLARCCDWDGVMEEVHLNPRDAKVVSEKDGTTALHLAVMSRTNPMMRDGKAGEPASLEVIQALVDACPEAAITRCSKKRYTPLHYACLVADQNYDMDDCSTITEILLKHAPFSPFVFTDDGFSALDVHILSYSQLHKHKQEVLSGAQTSTAVLRTLLTNEPSLADARVYRNKIRGPLELLYRCNIEEFKEAVAAEEATELTADQLEKQKERFGEGGALSDWWAWKWSLLLLKFASISAGQEVEPFKAVHAAARLVGCPLPILALAVSTFPQQVTERDKTGDIYNVSFYRGASRGLNSR